MPKIILAAGAFRSGSTWLYNAIRLILQVRQIPFAAGWVEDIAADSRDEGEYVLVKIHEPSEEWRGRAWRILTSHRDPRDVASSAADFLKLTESADLLRSVERAVTDHTYWAAHSHYDMSYEAMRGNREATLGEVAAALGISLSADEAARIALELEAMPEPKGSDKYDSKSLLHPTHRFDGTPGGWARRLTEKQAELIVDRFRDWMIRYGYLR
jgi:hypothetical protein